MKKIEIKPTQKQKKILKQWNDHSRYTYNKALEIMNSIEKNKYLLKQLPFSYTLEPIKYQKIFHDNLITEKINKKNNTEFLLKTPKDIRYHSVKNLLSALKSCFSNLKNKTQKFFEFKFRKKKYKSWTIDIEKPHIKRLDNKKEFELYSRITKKTVFRSLEDLPEINHDSKLHFDGLSYYLLIPIIIESFENNKRNICSLDPGLRTFQTIYSPNGNSYKIGNNAYYNRILPLSEKIDNLISYIKTKKIIKRKRNTKKKISYIRKKIKNLTKELHDKTINFLTKNFKTIINPKANTKDKTLRYIDNIEIPRKIGKKTSRGIFGLSHYTFNTRLINKAKLRGVKVIETTEEYTSKTCGKCGRVNGELGSSKIFKCSECLYETDRDFNGARNILLKNLSLFQ
jgi:transposase